MIVNSNNLFFFIKLKHDTLQLLMEKFIYTTLHEASELIRFNSNQYLSFKKTNDFIDYAQAYSEYDKIVEGFIIKKIRESNSEINIISEESTNKYLVEESAWVIDPIDGTMNFIKGLSHFCLSMSYWENGIILYSGVYSPVLDEFYFAEKGKGAFLNKQRIRVSSVERIEDSLIFMSGLLSFKKHKKEEVFYSLVNNIKNFRIFSSSILDMCFMACGRGEARIFADCKFWDLSGGKLIIEEAGGKISNWKDDDIDMFSPFIVASNGLINEQIKKILND